jgi:hypothetical protein
VPGCGEEVPPGRLPKVRRRFDEKLDHRMRFRKRTSVFYPRGRLKSLCDARARRTLRAMMKSIKLTASSLFLGVAVACFGLAACDDSEDPPKVDARPADGPVAPTPDAGPDRAPADAPVVDAPVVDAPVRDATPGQEALPRPDVSPSDVPRVDGGPVTTMSFFITSTGSEAMGGNLGGLAGADMKCQTLATAVGLGAKTWRAYLSAHAVGGTAAVNARDRIGAGPWYNYNGIQIAASVVDLHTGGAISAPRLNLDTGLDEKGVQVPARGAPNPPGNQHDILTGSDFEGMALPATPDRTCANWTSNAGPQVDGGAAVPTAQVGHYDRAGGSVQTGNSWNSAHATPACDQASIARVGGAGRFYCFATN